MRQRQSNPINFGLSTRKTLYKIYLGGNCESNIRRYYIINFLRCEKVVTVLQRKIFFFFFISMNISSIRLQMSDSKSLS